MKRLHLLSIVAAMAFITLAAESAEAQCFDCVQQAGSNPVNMYCQSGGTDFSACTTVTQTDPVTCESSTVCANTYACTTDPGGGDYCSNSSCDPNMPWGEINNMQDLYTFYCYHYNTMCEYV